MVRKCSSNVARWLFAAGVLTAMSVSGVFTLASAAPCAQSAADSCTQQGATSWKPVLVELRNSKARLESLRFAERVKRHLGRQFAKRKLQFAQHQVRLELQRRAHKRHIKARQFAAARRHAAQHVHKLRHAHVRHLRGFAFKNPAHHEASSSDARHIPHWRPLLRHDAHNDAQPQPRAN